jgi:putative hydrolase of the HAD superfamily
MSASSQFHNGPVLIFDGDDTLWDTMHLYTKAKLRFLAAMQACGFDRRQVQMHFEERDKRNVRVLGFSRKRFAVSMIQTYRFFTAQAHRIPAKSVERRIATIANSVFGERARRIPGAIPTLKKLRGFCKLILFTKGDLKVQRRRIRDAGLGRFFDRIHVLRTKNSKTLGGLIQRYNLPRERTWSVGNSIKSDINPALRNGLRAIWVPKETWAYEEEALLTKKGVVRVSSLAEVPRIVRRSGGAG